MTFDLNDLAQALEATIRRAVYEGVSQALIDVNAGTTRLNLPAVDLPEGAEVKEKPRRGRKPKAPETKETPEPEVVEQVAQENQVAVTADITADISTVEVKVTTPGPEDDLYYREQVREYVRKLHLQYGRVVLIELNKLFAQFPQFKLTNISSIMAEHKPFLDAAFPEFEKAVKAAAEEEKKNVAA